MSNYQHIGNEASLAKRGKQKVQENGNNTCR